MKKIARKKKLKMKTAILISISIGAVAVLVSILTGVISYQGENLSVAKIDGEPISVREFRQILIKNRAGIYDYFKQKYGVEDSLKFWSTGYNGEVPAEIARKKTMDECVRIKLQQILARQKGLIQDISYTAFLKDLDAENKRRKKAVENGKALYGPIRYTESEYFNYVFSNMIIKLKEKLAEGELSEVR